MTFVCVETYPKKNIGTLMRCAIGFGAKGICIVGSTKFSTHGAHEAKKYLPVIHFHYWRDCSEFLREQGCEAIFGVSDTRLQTDADIVTNDDVISPALSNLEVPRQSVDVDSVDFSPHPNAAFIVSDRSPLTEEQLSLCDQILHVSFPDNALASYVHYDAKLSICLLRHASTFKTAASARIGEKYILPNQPDSNSVIVSSGDGNGTGNVVTLRARKFIEGKSSSGSCGGDEERDKNDELVEDVAADSLCHMFGEED